MTERTIYANSRIMTRNEPGSAERASSPSSGPLTTSVSPSHFTLEVKVGSTHSHQLLEYATMPKSPLAVVGGRFFDLVR